MKRYLCISITLLFLMLCCTSCFTFMQLASVSKNNQVLGKDFGKDIASMELTTFQKISDFAALSTTGKGDVVCVLADFEGYYDGQKLSGQFVKKGVFSYSTPLGVEKHVLIYARKKDLRRLESKFEQFLEEKPEVVVDNIPQRYV